MVWDDFGGKLALCCESVDVFLVWRPPSHLLRPDDSFSAMAGVVQTIVGYTGGKKPKPTYHSIGDHTEAILIEFDPTVVTYKQLLWCFFNSHDPTVRRRKIKAQQYKSAIYIIGEQQAFEAEEALFDQIRNHGDVDILTDIYPMTGFYKAEEYHQKYLAKERLTSKVL